MIKMNKKAVTPLIMIGVVLGSILLTWGGVKLFNFIQGEDVEPNYSRYNDIIVSVDKDTPGCNNWIYTANIEEKKVQLTACGKEYPYIMKCSDEINDITLTEAAHVSGDTLAEQFCNGKTEKFDFENFLSKYGWMVAIGLVILYFTPIPLGVPRFTLLVLILIIAILMSPLGAKILPYF